MKYIYLSHYLEDEIPTYGNNRVSLNITPIKSISKGDSANVYQFTMENHWGTHIDAPAHFFFNAPSICDFQAEHWIFKKSQVIEIPPEEGKFIDVDILQRHKINTDTDLLLIKTGFQRWRGKEKYSIDNPGIKSDAALWLRKNYPSLRAIGFDFVSLSSYTDRDEGRKSHCAFLDPDGNGNPILIIEDMNLQASLEKLKDVWVFPLLIKGIDSAPCTVIGVFE
ncbi:Kynurenine formamidase [uncultured archaeon]|nr:Kynurenine formamidase [uncultured archaeon]